MRTKRDAQHELRCQLDPEHEAFRGVGMQSAVRLGVVLATIVVAVTFTALSAGPSDKAAQAPLIQGLLALLG